jgi:hypothetical protein
LRRAVPAVGRQHAVGLQAQRARARAQHDQRHRHDAEEEREPEPGRGAGQAQALYRQSHERRHQDAAKGEARGGDREGKRPAHAEPARHHRRQGHEAGGAVAKPKYDVEGIELPQLPQQAGGRERQGTDTGACGDDDAGIDAVDQPPRNHAADAAGNEEGGRGAAGEAHRKALLGHEGRQQDRQVVEGEPRRRRHDDEHRGHDVPAVEDAA